MLNQIFNFICSIPESIGWTLVAIVGVLLLFMLYKLGATFVEMWKQYHEEDNELECK